VSVGDNVAQLELITIVAVATMNVQSEVQAHVRGALNRGATKEEITEIILHLAPYIGFPKTNHAFASAQKIFDEWEKKSKDEWKPL
jgi:4-carboxymuconolactone decarboxylase